MLPTTPEQQWQLPLPLPALEPALEAELAQLQLAPELLAVLRRRGFGTIEAFQELLEPPQPPDALRHFPDLRLAVQRLSEACKSGEAVAICGDYDADGMTSTALLVGVLQRLGAQPIAAIPSRQEDGYGLNAAMVERLAADGVRLLVTVDNGVAASEALLRAEELGVAVIVTDHHTLPEKQPPWLALLHPACTPENSPFRGLAGVGLAYVLATALARRHRRKDGLAIAMDLFCIGTIADMAPLLGVNRRWLQEGLPQLRSSSLPGLRALQQVAGLEEQPLDAEAVGFQLAPRINAVGRLGDPMLVVELLTTEDPERALELARQCETLNRQRREICAAIEAEAVALLEADGDQRQPFLLLAQAHWHHGVIGIVASRLVERYGLPVALLAGDGDELLRASVRAPRGFAVDRALQACSELLERHGGHPAAGGFTVKPERVDALHGRLCDLASDWISGGGSRPNLEPEAMLALGSIDRHFHQQLRRLEPFGIGLAAPIFWCPGCRVISQRLLRGGHLQLTLERDGNELRAMAWRWNDERRLPQLLDVAFRLRLNRWQGQESLQLELVGLRPSSEQVVLRRRDRAYWCQRQGEGLLIRNDAGEELAILRLSPEGGFAADEQHPYVQSLIQEAALALGLVA
ncbi:MAG: single-stranded-DNA-specific exonuclease RecJ [Prochlorococcaceae cyanobacterium]